MALTGQLQDAYNLLEVNPTDDLQTVKAAYKKLALLHHPDRSKDGEGEKFKAVSAAYETICKHVKGQDEVDLDDPDFQILFELFHLFNFIGSQREEALNLEEQSQGYASGGSSCEGDDDDIEDDVDDRTISDIDDSRGYTDGEDEEGTEEQENSSEWESETPVNEIGRSGSLGHVCHSDHGACHHTVNLPFRRSSGWSLPIEAIKPEDVELFRKHELQSRLAGGKKRVESDRDRKIRVKLLLAEQKLAQERREVEAKKKKEAARLAREQEKEEAAARRAAKNAKKRAAAQEKAALAKKVAQEKLLLAQSDRSAAFDQLTACAKVHDDEEYYAACETVKKLISDKNVQVSGWEKLPDLAPEVQSSTRPMQQSTLLHLAVQASDPELVAWFCNRGARADECDISGFKPFHRALENGDKKMLDYFFDAFPPYDQKGKEVAVNMKVYEPSNPENPDASLVMLATRTGDAEVVDYVLDRATLAEVECAYRYAQAQVRQARFHKPTIAGWKAVQRMLQEREGFAPPPEIALRHHPRPPQFPREGKTQYKGRVLAKGPRNAERAVQFSTDAPRADTSTV